MSNQQWPTPRSNPENATAQHLIRPEGTDVAGAGHRLLFDAGEHVTTVEVEGTPKEDGGKVSVGVGSEHGRRAQTVVRLGTNAENQVLPQVVVPPDRTEKGNWISMSL